MSQFITLANNLREIGSSILIVTASIWFAFKYLPIQMKKQGEIEEILRNNTAVIENCTEVLRMVSLKNDRVQETLLRCEEGIDEVKIHQTCIEVDLHDIKRRRGH